MHAAAIQQAEGLTEVVGQVVGEYAGQQGAGQAAQTVHADCTDRVVNLELLVDKLNAKDDYETGDDADEGRADRGDRVTAGGDGDQTGKRAV